MKSPARILSTAEIKGRIALALIIAALLPLFAMDFAAARILPAAPAAFIDFLVIGIGLGAAALGMMLGWLISGAIVAHAHERVSLATAAQAALARELQVERDRLANAMDGSQLAMWELDMLAGYIELSANWSTLLGEPTAETRVQIAELIDRVPESEQAACWSAFHDVLRGRSEFYDVEHRVRRHDGSFLWIRSRGAVSARTDDGRVARMTGTNFDITARRAAEVRLQESEAKLRLVTDNLPLMVSYLDADLRFLFANEGYLAFLGVDLGAILGRPASQVAGAFPTHLPGFDDLRAGRGVMFEEERTDGMRTTRSFEVRIAPQLDGETNLVGLFVVVQDVTEDRRARRKLAASTQALQLVTDSVPVMISRIGLDGEVLFANRRFRDHRGIPVHEPGMQAAETAPDTWARISEELPRLRKGEHVVYDRTASVPGDDRHFEVHLVPQRDEERRLESVFVLENDVTERTLAARVFEQMALTDPLTGLPNKRLLLDRMEHALAQCQRRGGMLAVLFVDLDGFKSINDGMGHAAGDALLQEVSARLRACARGSDTVARFGGDEFIVLLEGCESVDDAVGVAQKVAASLSRPYLLPTGVAGASCSIGIAVHPDDGKTPDILLQNADAAMYRAKKAGKNRFALFHAHSEAPVPFPIAGR